MCGIVGIYRKEKSYTINSETLKKANNSLIKRGPDDAGVFENSDVALAHRRLSIIDLTTAACQPMTTLDGRFTIVFNGEIYNYKELQNLLTNEEKNELRSSGDTEIFLVLYSKLKEKLFNLLQGFFAAAIYDSTENSLVLVRDPFGKKPLLVFQDNEKLFFASEMKALFNLGIPKEINWNILPLFFQLNYIPQPYSIMKNVSKIAPGHYLIIKGKTLEINCYFDLQLKSENYQLLNYDAAQNKLKDLVQSAVKKRMISDVPLGSFLSGGIDSSIITAIASRYTKNLKTFSVGFADKAFYDETKYAALIAKKYKTDHTEFKLNNNDFLENIADVLDYIDEPFADSASIPQFILSKKTKDVVTVALSGDGGDEVFSGYNKHLAEYKARQNKISNYIFKALLPVVTKIPNGQNNFISNSMRQVNKYAKGLNMNFDDRYWEWSSIQDLQASMAMLTENVKGNVDIDISDSVKKSFIQNIKGDDFSEILLADMKLVLPGDMLVKIDLMGMANSLEIRSPFLDKEIVEFAFGLPANYKITDKEGKKILRDSFKDLLPEEIYNRQKKGFDIPLLGWFKKELWDLIDCDLLKDEFIIQQGIFKLESINSIKRKLFSNNPGNVPEVIWALVVFQSWWKKYMLSQN